MLHNSPEMSVDLRLTTRYYTTEDNTLHCSASFFRWLETLRNPAPSLKPWINIQIISRIQFSTVFVKAASELHSGRFSLQWVSLWSAWVPPRMASFLWNFPSRIASMYFFCQFVLYIFSCYNSFCFYMLGKNAWICSKFFSSVSICLPFFFIRRHINL
jgi:hypothetical protein